MTSSSTFTTCSWTPRGHRVPTSQSSAYGSLTDGGVARRSGTGCPARGFVEGVSSTWNSPSPITSRSWSNSLPAARRSSMASSASYSAHGARRPRRTAIANLSPTSSTAVSSNRPHFAHLSRLNGQLDAAHLADGFEPARQDGYSRELDPVELVLRACHHWDTTAGRDKRPPRLCAEPLRGVHPASARATELADLG